MEVACVGDTELAYSLEKKMQSSFPLSLNSLSRSCSFINVQHKLTSAMR
jgi:hypothetical protein